MGLLTGKTALITGAARGIGKAVAMKFAQEGANIAFTDLVLNDDMAAGLEATRKEIEAIGVTCRLTLVMLLISRRQTRWSSRLRKISVPLMYSLTMPASRKMV